MQTTPPSTSIPSATRTGRRRHFAIVVAALAVLVAATFGDYLVDLGSVARDDPMARCAAKYEDRKTDLRGVRWNWAWPGWNCRFHPGPDGHVP